MKNEFILEGFLNEILDLEKRYSLLLENKKISKDERQKIIKIISIVNKIKRSIPIESNRIIYNKDDIMGIVNLAYKIIRMFEFIN